MNNSTLLNTYMNQINNSNNLDNSVLLKKNYMNNKDIFNIIIENNLKLVVKIAKKYEGNNIDIMDLIECGNIGLIKALTLFDKKKNVQFTTYAYKWIEQYIQKAVAEQKYIYNIPTNIIPLINKVKILINDGLNFTEISKKLNISIENINNIVGLVYGHISINIDVDGEGNNYEIVELTNNINPHTEYISKYNKEYVYDLINILSEKEKKIIGELYGLKGYKLKTKQDIAKGLGITKQSLEYFVEKILQKINTPN